ncbi:MAG TPA: hypothetical protein VLF43_03170 [Candidatus Saccharimonadales bacterium]|nr:hypothetical protein [Candidatus Saccharimonadales bacterium]
MIRRVLIVCALFVSAYVGLVAAPRAHAAPVACTGPVVAFDRQRWCGYFHNVGFDDGEEVRIGGIPGSVNTANEWINLIKDDLSSGNQHKVTAAQFVVLTMLGEPGGSPKSVSAAQLADWEARVQSYASTSENGNRSTGPNGRIDWNVSMHLACGIVNTYYQTAQHDVAPFRNNAANSNCDDPSSRDRMIVFRDASGNIVYMIRRLCMNPMGNLKPLAEPKPANFNLRPAITTSIGGTPASTVEVGDTVRFQYFVANAGPDASPAVNCTLYANVHTGYFAPAPGSATTGSNPAGSIPPATGCPRAFTVGNTRIAIEDVPITADNRTICRSLFVSPATPIIGSRGYEACVQVVRKPYVKVFGGDISAGNGLQTSTGTCANTAASIVGWNKRAPGYAGSGVQYAAYAAAAIRDVATASGNVAGAPAPSGLAFANTAANPAAGLFGGSFGQLPCIPDYYAGKPATAMILPTSVGAITASGVYQRNTSLSLAGGVVQPGIRVTAYVDGDVYITSNITYGGTWTPATVPLFRLIVRGNIYIDRNVTQLDGLYIAQPQGSSGGVLYTCATGAAALVPSNSLAATCGKPLTINGAVTARSIMLLRTNGSLSQSTPTENSTSTTMAEKFNFVPSLWIAQPVGEVNDPPAYDSITGLPPIL